MQAICEIMVSFHTYCDLMSSYVMTGLTINYFISVKRCCIQSVLWTALASAISSVSFLDSATQVFYSSSWHQLCSFERHTQRLISDWFLGHHPSQHCVWMYHSMYNSGITWYASLFNVGSLAEHKTLSRFPQRRQYQALFWFIV